MFPLISRALIAALALAVASPTSTGTFTAAGAVSPTTLVRKGEQVNVVIVKVSTAFTGSVKLERSESGAAWHNIKSYSTAINDTVANDYGRDLYLRLRVNTIGSHDTLTYSIGTVTATITLQSVQNADGAVVFKVTNRGLVTPHITADTLVGRITGTADSATGATRAQKLTTARTINGTSFDGTGNVTVTADASTLTGTTLNSTVVTSSLTSLGTQTVDVTLTNKNVVPNVTSGVHGLVLQSAGSSQAGIDLNFGTGEIRVGAPYTTADYYPVIYSDGIASLTFGLGAAPSATFVGSVTAGTSLTVGTSLLEKVATVAYSASITPDASLGNTWTITATNGTAFTVNAPTNPVSGERITLTIRNASGGTQGAVTFNAAFKTAGYTVAANGFSASAIFVYDGTNWVQRTAWVNTIPN